MDAAATVTLLPDPAEVHPDDPVEQPLPFDADVVTIEQPMMELRARHSCALGAALKIETADAVWLGEVERCAAGGDGRFAIGVRLRHVLRDFETLAKLAERFGTASPRGLARAGTENG